MIYTDTNGQYPKNLSLALRLLEIAMESRPLNEINIERFNEVKPAIDAQDWEGITWRNQ
jgi:hypothetical protein